jgi:hypothetical protein
LEEFVSDPNIPGLKVCRNADEGCKDVYDPYRLPARLADKMTLPFYRPDQPMEMPTTPYVPRPPRPEDPQPVMLDDVVRDG